MIGTHSKFIRDKIIAMGNRGHLLEFHRWRDEVRRFEQIERDKDRVAANDFSGTSVARVQSDYRRQKDAGKMRDIGVTSDRTEGKGQTSGACQRCGRSHAPAANCPAANKTCRKCGKNGHFGIVCRSKANLMSQSTVRAVQEGEHPTQESQEGEDRDNSEVWLNHIRQAVAAKGAGRIDKLPVTLFNKEKAALIYFIPDTGAEVNCITPSVL